MQFIPMLTNQVSLPFKVDISSSYSNNMQSLNIQIELVPIREQIYLISDIRIKILVPENYTNSNLSVSTGDFEFDNKEKRAIWKIAKLDKEISSASLKGNLITDNNIASSVLSLSCQIDKFSVTGGAVTKVSVTKNPKNINIYKAGKCVTHIKNLEIIF